MTHRMGLTRQASDDVGRLFTSTAATSSTITGASSLLFVLGGLAAASAIQQLYLRVFDLPGKKRDRLRVLVWLGVTVGCLFLFPMVSPGLRGVAPVLFWIVYAGVAVVFGGSQCGCCSPEGSLGEGCCPAPSPRVSVGPECPWCFRHCSPE